MVLEKVSATALSLQLPLWLILCTTDPIQLLPEVTAGLLQASVRVKQ